MILLVYLIYTSYFSTYFNISIYVGYFYDVTVQRNVSEKQGCIVTAMSEEKCNDDHLGQWTERLSSEIYTFTRRHPTLLIERRGEE